MPVELELLEVVPLMTAKSSNDDGDARPEDVVEDIVGASGSYMLN